MYLWMLELVLPEHITQVHSGIYHLSLPIHSFVGDKLRILLTKCIFVRIAKYIFPNYTIYLFKWQIYLSCKMCLSRTYYASFALLLVWHLSPSPPIHSYVDDKLGIPLTNSSRRYMALPLPDPSEVIESINVKEKAEY